MVAAFGKDDGVECLCDSVGVGLPFGVVRGVFHEDRLLLDVVDFLRDFAVFAAQPSLKVGICELGAHVEIDIHLVDEVGFGGRADL